MEKIGPGSSKPQRPRLPQDGYVGRQDNSGNHTGAKFLAGALIGLAIGLGAEHVHNNDAADEAARAAKCVGGSKVISQQIYDCLSSDVNDKPDSLVPKIKDYAHVDVLHNGASARPILDFAAAKRADANEFSLVMPTIGTVAGGIVGLGGTSLVLAAIDF